jgi:hypothetical protein
VSASQHNSTHNSITKTTKIIKRFTISIELTAHTENEAVGMAADNTTSVEEATMAMAITAMATVAMAMATVAMAMATVAMAMATVAIATMAWATVVMATMAATIITVAQTREAYGEATVEEVKKDTKAFNRRNTTSATNQDAGLTSIP